MKNKTKTNKINQQGFSIVELLNVIVVLGVLATIAIPISEKYRKISYDVWIKNELTEQSKYLHLAYLVDGGFYQHLVGMGYIPSTLLKSAGFYLGSAILDNCCDILQAGFQI